MYSTAGPVPLEIKTGKTTFSAEHKGQVLLTTLIILVMLAAAGIALVVLWQEKQLDCETSCFIPHL